MLPTVANIIDIGCGTGATLRRAADFVTDGVLIGIDPVPRMLEIACEETAAHPSRDRIEFRQGSAENLPVEDDFADFVFAFDSFDFWSFKERGLDEVRRVLRPEGRFFVVKDCDLPGAKDASLTFVEKLTHASFTLLSEQLIEEEGVSFTLWVSAPSG